MIMSAILNKIGGLFKRKPENKGPSKTVTNTRTNAIGRNSTYYKETKAEFNRDNVNVTFTPGVKLARKAHMGTVGLPHGRRGMIARVDEFGRYRIGY